MKKLIIAAIAVTATMCFAFAPKEKAGVTVMITHEVKDFSTWKKGFDGDEPNRKKAGLKFVALYRDRTNPNIITGVMEAPSAEAVQGFLNNPQLKEAMQKGGVISAPGVKILDRVQ